MNQLLALALAVSIVAILISLPAVFLSVYVLVLIKARDLSERIAASSIGASRDPLIARELEGDPRSAMGMYELGSNEEFDDDPLDDDSLGI